MTETTPVERGDPSETATEALGASMSRREALGKMSYVAPAIVALQVSKPGLGLGRSGARGRRGNNGFGQENQGAPKDGPPAGKLKNDKPGPR